METLKKTQKLHERCALAKNTLKSPMSKRERQRDREIVIHFSLAGKLATKIEKEVGGVAYK